MPDQDKFDWQNNPDFKALPLAEKHKVLLQIEPDYKGLPPKEQAKALDAIHYGTLGQIPGKGIPFLDTGAEGIGTGIWNTLKGMVPPAPPGRPLSKEFWFGKSGHVFDWQPNEESGIGKAANEMSAEYQRSRAAGSNPLAAAASSGMVGAADVLTGVSEQHQKQLAEQGLGGQIVGESAVPAAAAAVMPAIMKGIEPTIGQPYSTPTPSNVPFPLTPLDVLHPKLAAGKLLKYGAQRYLERKGMSAPPTPDQIRASQETAGKQAAQAGEASNKLEQQYREAASKEQAGKVKAQEEAGRQAAKQGTDINDIYQQYLKAGEKINKDLAAKELQHAKELETRLANNEKARQREITDWAKLDKVSEADHAEFEERMNELNAERQKFLADQEKLRNQHAQDLMQRGKAQAAIDTAREKHLSDLQNERQSQLADEERLKEQHAASLNARKAPKSKASAAPAPASSPFAGMTSTATPIGSAELPPAPQGAPPQFPTVESARGSSKIPEPPPPPPPTTTAPATIRMGTGIGAEGLAERPTVGSKVAERARKSSILSRGRTLYRPGEEPELGNPEHEKMLNDLQQSKTTAELERMAKPEVGNDRFAAFLVRYMRANGRKWAPSR